MCVLLPSRLTVPNGLLRVIGLMRLRYCVGTWREAYRAVRRSSFGSWSASPGRRYAIVHEDDRRNQSRQDR